MGSGRSRQVAHSAPSLGTPLGQAVECWYTSTHVFVMIGLRSARSRSQASPAACLFQALCPACASIQPCFGGRVVRGPASEGLLVGQHCNVLVPCAPYASSPCSPQHARCGPALMQDRSGEPRQGAACRRVRVFSSRNMVCFLHGEQVGSLRFGAAFQARQVH